MDAQDIICQAIGEKRLIQFYYRGGNRIVEPHMVAYNSANHAALSGWFLSGYSESREGQGWREYLLDEISSVLILDETFSEPRPGYKPDGGKSFHSIICSL
jgi:predicted DNA-binding transcriptional regulator YafY